MGSGHALQHGGGGWLNTTEHRSPPQARAPTTGHQCLHYTEMTVTVKHTCSQWQTKRGPTRSPPVCNGVANRGSPTLVSDGLVQLESEAWQSRRPLVHNLINFTVCTL